MIRVEFWLLYFCGSVLTVNAIEFNDKLFAQFKDQDIDSDYALSLYKNIPVLQTIECREEGSQGLAWMHYSNSRCINIVSDVFLPPCLYGHILRNDLAYMIKTKKYIRDRNVEPKQVRRIMCVNYVIFTEELDLMKSIFDNEKLYHFHPFTKLFLFAPPNVTIPQATILMAMKHGFYLFEMKNNLFNSSLPNFNLDISQLKDLYSNQTIDTAVDDETSFNNFFGRLENHPLFNKSVTKGRTFRIAMYHCPPYVIVRNATAQM